MRETGRVTELKEFRRKTSENFSSSKGLRGKDGGDAL